METSDSDPDEGFAAVFRDHQAGALRLATVLCGDPAGAEDAVAEAFARMYPHWLRGRVDDPGAYLRRAVVNQVRGSWRRRAVRRRHLDRRSADERGELRHDEHLADRDAIRVALAQIPPRQAAAVVLRYLDGLTEAETAATLGITVGTVKSSTSRALDRLRVLLDDDSGGGR